MIYNDLKCDGNVYLVFGEDEKCYGTYLLRDRAELRREEMEDHYGANFRIEMYGLGNLRVR